MASRFPEHDKLHAIGVKSQAIGEFLDMGGYVLAKEHDHDEAVKQGHEGAEELCGYGEWGLERVTKPINDILAEYFEIDQKKLEAEKVRILKTLRKNSEAYEEEKRLTTYRGS